MKEQGSRISNAEWEVMNIVWDENPILAQTIIERLAERKDWGPGTVKTLITRLTKKSVLGFEKEKNHYLYHPLVSKEKCQLEESKSLLNTVFGGLAAPMMLHFVDNIDLKAEEIQQLKEILESKEKKLD